MPATGPPMTAADGSPCESCYERMHAALIDAWNSLSVQERESFNEASERTMLSAPEYLARLQAAAIQLQTIRERRLVRTALRWRLRGVTLPEVVEVEADNVASTSVSPTT